MADYFPLLSRTIASLGNSTAEQRQIVYQRARIVVQAQLSAIDPPMSEEGIAEELELFEQSVVRLENEMLSLESLKGDSDEDVVRENSTRRHISARLSDLMAKAAAARTAATQERLKADLPVGADPALSGPAVKVDAVPVPSSAQLEAEPFIGADGEGVDHPLAPTSIIEGDPLDVLAAAHIRKVADEQDQKTDTQDLPPAGLPDGEGLSAVSPPPVSDVRVTVGDLDATPPDPAFREASVPVVEALPELAVSETGTGGPGAHISAPAGGHFAMIPWLSSAFVTDAAKETGAQHDAPQKFDPVRGDEKSVDDRESRADAGETGHASDSDQVDGPPVPEMPQIAAGDNFSGSADPDADRAPVAMVGETEVGFPALKTISDGETDPEAAKAAFWGDAYQAKKDDAEEKDPDEHGSGPPDLADETASASLMELAEDESRPRLLQKRRLDRAMVRKIVMVAVFTTVTAAVGITAWILRDQPSDFEQSAGLQRSDLSRKINDRLPSDAAPQAEATKALPQAGQIVGQRAILLEEVPDGQPPPPPVVGQVSWSLETIRDSNGVGDVAVKAEVKGLTGSLSGMVLSLKRNRDASFPASHLLEVTFVTPQTSQNGQVRDIGLPEMRVDETTRGAALFGLPVPVTDNVFLVGLTNLPDRIEFNVDLLRSRKWIVVPIRFATGRRAALMIEKGLAGDRALLDAFQAWK